ncbi:hypothetical protein PR048_018103 [Dryococelus australis]|uniref:Uncharacterized protein n=1 Tax=Dryococelus australis TaxID=614101 RepID=A0ABQ9HBG2_9NEOP|nr:hypothetical protein PR048_018103 [Dryococelus australis]
MIVSTLFSSQMSLSALWELDVLGIGDPDEQGTKEEQVSTVKGDFEKKHQKKCRDPWIEGHLPLPTNYHTSRKRVENLTQKLTLSDIGVTYAEVFEEWKREGIIEYEQGSTNVKPVFDASCNVPHGPSLNDCLDKDQT